MLTESPISPEALPAAYRALVGRKSWDWIKLRAWQAGPQPQPQPQPQPLHEEPLP